MCFAIRPFPQPDITRRRPFRSGLQRLLSSFRQESEFDRRSAVGWTTPALNNNVTATVRCQTGITELTGIHSLCRYVYTVHGARWH